MSYAIKNTYAPNPNVERGQPTHISTDPKGEKLLYVASKNVVIRSIANPLDCDVYTQHVADCTTARYAPSGYYIASADASGKVRVWDTVNAEHILKIELPVLGGPIRDIAWTEDSKRILAVGEGRECFGVPFLWDSGSTVGSITGHSKSLYTCDVKPSRPYRAITGGLDAQVNFYPGVPFKFDHSLKDHTRFVNCVRYSPDGSQFATVASDKSGFIYDGKEGTKKVALSTEKGEAHTAGIYNCSWNKDGTKLLTASADKSCKIWDAASGKCEKTFTFAEKAQTEDQQLGCLWAGDNLITLSLGGVLAYLDESNPTKPKKLIHGHSKFVTALAYDKDSNTLMSGSYDGSIIRWKVDTGETSVFAASGAAESQMLSPRHGHTNQIKRLVASGGALWSCAMDDAARTSSLTDMVYGAPIGTEGLPSDLAVHSSGVVVVATNKAVQVLQGGAVKSTTAVSFEALSVAINSTGDEVAVGGSDNKVHIYSLSGGALSEKKVLEKHRGPVTAAAYAPDGSHLATGDKKNYVMVWGKDHSLKQGEWCYHSAPVTRINWSPDSKHLCSSGLDSLAIVWDIEDNNMAKKRIELKRAHPGGVTDTLFIDNNTLATGGYDCCIRTWTITY